MADPKNEQEREREQQIREEASWRVRLEILMEQQRDDVRAIKDAIHGDAGLKAEVRQLQEDRRADRSTLNLLTRWLWIVGAAMAAEGARRLAGIVSMHAGE